MCAATWNWPPRMDEPPESRNSLSAWVGIPICQTATLSKINSPIAVEAVDDLYFAIPSR
jgi:hypothetical protein